MREVDYKIEMKVLDDIQAPFSKRNIPYIIKHTLRTGEIVNIYKFMEFKGFYDFMIRLDDYITIIAIELFVNALDEHGIIIHDTPCYRDMMIEFLMNAGIPFDEEMYDVVDASLAEIENILVARYSETTETFKLVEFLLASKPYTNINYIVAKLYSIISKNYSSIISEIKSIDNVSSKLADAVDMIDISSSGLEYNENVLEMISYSIKEEKLYHLSFLEYMNGTSRDIYAMLLGGKDV